MCFGACHHPHFVVNCKNTGIYSIDEGIDKDGESLNFVVTRTFNPEIIVGKIDIDISNDGEIRIGQTLIDPFGMVTDADTNEVIEGAEVTLYYADTKRNIDNGNTPDRLVDLPSLEFPPGDNNNPHVTDENGNYAWMAYPESDYYIVAEKDGYETYVSPTISMEYEIIKHDFEMEAVIPEDDTPSEDADESDNKVDSPKDKDSDSEGTDKEGNGENLPDTATTMYNTLIIGFSLIIIGAILYIYLSRRRVREK